MSIFLRVLLALMCIVPNAYAGEMSVSDAYRALNHKQTTYSQSRSTLNEEDSKFLEHLFFVTDQAFRYRMMMLNAFYDGSDSGFIVRYNREIDNLLSSFSLTSAPTDGLLDAQVLIVLAIEDQQKFFNEWALAYGTAQYDALKKNYTSHSLVQSSHKGLYEAYLIIKRQYPHESPHNIQAFYDHLCVLDFI